MLSRASLQVGAAALPPCRTSLPVRPCSRGVSAGPLTSSIVVAVTFLFVNGGNFGHQRIIRVRVSEKRADGQENLGDGESGRPLILQDIEADRAIAVDVRMVNFRREAHLGRLEWVVGGEVDVQEENASRVRRILRTHDRSLPVELVLLVGWAGRAVCRRIPTEVNELLLDSFKRHNIVYNLVICTADAYRRLSHSTNLLTNFSDILPHGVLGFWGFGVFT